MENEKIDENGGWEQETAHKKNIRKFFSSRSFTK